MKLYRDFSSVDDLNWQYLPSKSGVDGSPYYDSWPNESEAVRQDLDYRADVPFGPTMDEYLDIFPASQKDAPVHLFIHGGYWRVFSPKDFSFVARELVAQGITVALNNYSLCPKVTIDEVVRQNRAAVKWLVDNAADFGGDPANITVSGHSAGGHLSAMAALADWQGEYGLEGHALKGVIGISGLYDLGPFPYTDLQSHLQFTREQIERNSPINQVRSPLPPVWLVVGSDETPEFHRQADAFAHALDGAGNRVERITVEDTNHFSVMQGFKDPKSRLFKLIRDACLDGAG